MGANILVLGGGPGGVTAATRLRALLGAEHQITLVAKDKRHNLGHSKVGVMLGTKRPADIVRDLNDLAKRNIQFRQAEVTAIDPRARSIRLGDEEVRADYLVISLGATLEPQRIPGLDVHKEGGDPLPIHTPYSLDGAIATGAFLDTFDGGELLIIIAGTPYQCPPAPYEIGMMLHWLFKWRDHRVRVRMHLFTPEARALPTLPDAGSERMQAMLQEVGIAFHPGHAIKDIDTTRKYVNFENGAAYKFHFLLLIPPHAAPPVVRDAFGCEGGWIKVQQRTLATDFERVYAIGDCTSIPTSGPKPLPKSAVFAAAAGTTVAENIAAEVTGKQPEARFDASGLCYVQTSWRDAGAVAGDFFADGGPAVQLLEPTPHLLAAANWWERGWLQRVF